MADQFQQASQLGLDQIADVVNRQKIGDRRLRNQMMQLGTTDPNAFAMQNKDFLQQAQQPQELMFAGSNNTPAAVQQDGYTLKGYDDAGLQSLYNNSPQYRGFDPSYTDSTGKKYFDLNQQNQIEQLGPNFIGGSKTSYDLNPTQAGGYYFSDPWGFSHSVDKINPNKYFVSGDTLNQRTRSGTADTFYGLDSTKDLSGLVYGMNKGKEGLFFNPNKTNISSLLTPGRNNSAYAEKKSGGILGPLNQLMNKVDPINGWVENTVGKGLGYDSGLDMVRNLGEPIGNLAGAIWSGGIPWGSIAMGAENASTGNWDAVGNNALNALTTYAGSNIPTDSVAGTGYSLGSSTANNAANSFLTNAATNYARTGDLGNALKSSAFSTASGLGGNWLSSNLNGSLGEIGSKALGGAASGGLNSLFTKNNPIQGSLFGGMSGGLHGFLNSTSRSNNEFNQQTNKQNKQTANNITNLAKTIYKMRK